MLKMETNVLCGAAWNVHDHDAVLVPLNRTKAVQPAFLVKIEENAKALNVSFCVFSIVYLSLCFWSDPILFLQIKALA